MYRHTVTQARTKISFFLGTYNVCWVSHCLWSSHLPPFYGENTGSSPLGSAKPSSGPFYFNDLAGVCIIAAPAFVTPAFTLWPIRFAIPLSASVFLFEPLV